MVAIILVLKENLTTKPRFRRSNCEEIDPVKQSKGKNLPHSLKRLDCWIKEFLVFSRFYLLFAAACLLVFWFSDPLNLWLRASVDTPWGMLTAAFVHENLSHLMNNLSLLFLVLFVLFSLNGVLPPKLRVSGGEAFVYGLEGSFFAMAGVVFLFWLYHFDNEYVLGASAVVGSLLGATFFLSLLSVYELPLTRRVRAVLLAALLPFTAYFSWLFVFGGGNLLVHFYSIALGLTVAATGAMRKLNLLPKRWHEM
jgi:membrane associated rhomboid family serine protease